MRSGGLGGVFSGTDRFRVCRQLGAGAMGVVYEALDRETGAHVALKTLHSVAPASLLSLKNEFRALQNIEHPNLVSLGELIESDGNWFFTMELVDGCNFVSYVRREAGDERAFADTMVAGDTGPSTAPAQPRAGVCDVARLRDAMRQLVGAVSALHASHCVHRDIKPSNILVDRSGRVVLCDFGLLAERGDDDSGDSIEEIVGTAPYMAPEQAVSGSVGAAADWYGVGAVLYEALTGTPPFTGAPLDILLRKQETVPPSPASLADVPASLSDLARDLLSIDPNKRPGPRAILERLGMAPTRTGMVRALGSEPVQELCGRERELGAIMDSLPTRDSLGPTLCAIQGVAGVGKSAVLTALSRQCREQGYAVLAGRCLESESVPFKAIDGVIDQLAAYMRRLPSDTLDAVLPDRAELLRRAFPVLGQVVPFTAGRQRRAPTEDLHDLRSETFGALRELLTRLAAPRPIVVVIDDFHWADRDSVELLRAVLRPPGAPRLGLVLASRTEVDEGMTDGLRLPVTNLMIGPLSATDAAELAKRLLRRFADADAKIDPEMVAAEARGIPLYVAELVRYAALVDGVTGETPSLQTALAARIARLRPETIRALELAALARAPISGAVLRDASGLSGAVFTASLASLRAAHLLRGSGVRLDDTVEPYHDHVRQVVRGSIDDARARELHLGLAAALAVSPRVPERAELLSVHLEAGGELEQAALYAEEAAAHARTVFAFDRAAQLLERALRLGTHGSGKERELLHGLADCLALAGRGPDSAGVYEQLAQVSKSAERLRCRMMAAEQYLVFGHLEKGQRALEKVLGEVGERLSPTPRRALAGLLWGRLRVRVRGLGWRAQSPADASARDLSRIDAFAAVAVGMGLVDTVRSADFQTRGLLLALRLGEPERVGRAMFYEAIASSMRGRRGIKRGRILWARAKDVAEEIDDPYLRALGVASGGMLSYFEGEFPRAVVELQEGEQRLRGQGRRAWGEINVDRTFQLFSLRMMGHVDELRRLANEYVWDAERRGDRYSATTFRRTSYLGLLADGDHAAAVGELERSSWTTPGGRWHLQDYFELHAVNELALYKQQAGDLLDSYARSYAEFERSFIPRAVQITRCEALFLWGRLALAHRDSEKGRAAAVAIGRRLLRERASFADVWGKLLLGTAAACEGETHVACGILTECAERAEEVNMDLCHAAARWRLAQLSTGDTARRHERLVEAWCERRSVRLAPALLAMMTPGLSPSA